MIFAQEHSRSPALKGDIQREIFIYDRICYEEKGDAGSTEFSLYLLPTVYINLFTKSVHPPPVRK